MANKTLILSKGFGALLALIRFFTCVCSIMTGQSGILSKDLGAQVALVRLFTRVRSMVAGQMLTPSKGFGALLTLIRFWLFTNVGLIMVDQSGIVSKGLGNLKATVGSLFQIFTHTRQRGLHSNIYFQRAAIL